MTFKRPRRVRLRRIWAALTIPQSWPPKYAKKTTKTICAVFSFTKKYYTVSIFNLQLSLLIFNKDITRYEAARYAISLSAMIHTKNDYVI